MAMIPFRNVGFRNVSGMTCFAFRKGVLDPMKPIIAIIRPSRASIPPMNMVVTPGLAGRSTVARFGEIKILYPSMAT